MIPSDLQTTREDALHCPGVPGEQYIAEDVPCGRVEAFFEAGSSHVARLWTVIDKHLGQAPRPRRVLDFGCGLGRFTLALARRCDEAIGVDSSPEILRLARAHAEDRHVHNVRFCCTDENLTDLEGPFDLVHSFTVFQHIRPVDGLLVLDRLMERLTPGGLAALHFTHSRHQLALQPDGHPGGLALAGRKTQRRVWPMFHYRVDDVLAVLHRRGCDVVTKDPTDHAGHLGSMMIVRRRGGDRAAGSADAGVYLSTDP